MFRLLFVAVCFPTLLNQGAYAQGERQIALPVEQEIPQTGPVREREDTVPSEGILERLLPFNPRTLKISGEIREQFESWSNREFGFAEDADDDYLLQRLYIDVEYRPADWLLLRSELGSSFRFGSPFDPSPIDEDPAYFQQLMSDVTLHDGPKGTLTAQLGRQTFSLGSGRLVATRNGPNVRRSFDAIRLRYETDTVSSQLLYGADVGFGGDAFDSEPSDERLLWGSYTTITPSVFVNLADAGGLDVYYLGYRNRNAKFDTIEGNEVRHSIGLRASGVLDDWDYNIEPVIQFGQIEDQEILAYTVATVIGRRFSQIPLTPRLGFKFDVISGDQDPSDGRLGTFNALYPNNSYFSEAAIFAPANLFDLNLNADIELTETLTCVILWDFLWRYSTSDAVYVPPGVPGLAGNSSTDRYIGDTISVALDWQPVPSVEMTAAYVHFTPGHAVTKPGGSQADFFLLWATWFF